MHFLLDLIADSIPALIRLFNRQKKKDLKDTLAKVYGVLAKCQTLTGDLSSDIRTAAKKAKTKANQLDLNRMSAIANDVSLELEAAAKSLALLTE